MASRKSTIMKAVGQKSGKKHRGVSTMLPAFDRLKGQAKLKTGRRRTAIEGSVKRVVKVPSAVRPVGKGRR